MRLWEDLSIIEKAKALINASDMLIEHILDGTIKMKISDKNVNMQLLNILKDMRKNENRTNAKLEILNNIKISKEIDNIAFAASEGSRYDDVGYPIMQ
jgi:hypothetical protein